MQVLRTLALALLALLVFECHDSIAEEHARGGNVVIIWPSNWTVAKTGINVVAIWPRSEHTGKVLVKWPRGSVGQIKGNTVIIWPRKRG